MQKKIIPILAALMLSLSPISQSGAQTTAPTTQPAQITLQQLQQLRGKLKDVNTVEADFVQEKKLSMMNHTLVIRGHFAMQKPDRFIWITREPVKYAVRVVGDEVQQWDEDTNRVDVMHMGGDPTFKAVSQQIQAWFLGNYGALSDSYQVDVLSEQPLKLSFSPKGESMVGKIIKHVQLTFADDERYIQQMIVSEASGDTTTLNFIHTHVNEPINDDVWRIPPK